MILCVQKSRKMVIKIPQLHNFLHSLEAFQDKVHAVPEWEISVSRKDDIPWSIVLSYLISTKFRDSEDFNRRIKTLTGKDENIKSVKKAVRYFNPFRNRFSCFFNPILQQVVSEFKISLNWYSLSTVADKISTASKLLNCTILLITSLGGDVKTRFFSINTTEKAKNEYSDIITLIASEVTDEETGISYTIYNFMLSSQLGLKLKRSALQFYLREAELSKKCIDQVMSVSGKDEHFLISMLKSDLGKVILDIYKSPYIVSKLSDAGYVMDPKSSDSESFSAIYHALIRRETKILYELYFFAANSCFESNRSYRDPDCHVVYNLQEIGKILSEDLLKSNDFKDFKNHHKIRESFDQLLRLNKFLTEVTSKILNIRQKLNFYEAMPDNVFEATNRRDIIVSILNVYEQFFKSENPENSDFSSLENYIKHKHYYYSIDVTTAICFFDNIIYLKERLALENNTFSDMEASFLFLVFAQVLFEKLPLKVIAAELHLPTLTNIEIVYAFPMIQRQLINAKTKEFCKALQDKTISKDSVLQFIPEHEKFPVLKYFPDVKDHLETARLKSYLNTALKVKVNDIKSVLVIERVLQVLGEYMKPETDNDISITRRMFPLCLPKDICLVLRQIRHEITHLKHYAFPSKFDTEKNYFLFKSIQKEIRFIKMYLQTIFQIQKLREAIYANNQFENVLKQITSSIHSYRYNFTHPFHIRDEMFMFCKMFPILCSKSFYIRFFNVLQTVLDNLEDEITQKLQNISSDTIDAVTNILWPLKFLLELSLFFPHLSNEYTSDLLNMINSVDECILCNEFGKRITDFIEKCKTFISQFYIPKQKKNIKMEESIKHTETYLKILRGSPYLSEFDKERITKEIPSSIKECVARKNRLIYSIENNDFSLTIEEQRKELEIPYLSNKKKKSLKDCYLRKDSKALEILRNHPDPISELEEVFSTNCIMKQNCASLCEIMKFSVETKKKLSNLVPGVKQNRVVNRLSLLLNRIKMLREILIEDNKEISELWYKIKSEISQKLFLEKTLKLLLRDRALQTSVEMLLFDCMIIFGKRKCIKQTWIKSCKLYSGINLRDVMSHGSPLLECLCSLLDPDDLLTETTCKVLRLIECEDIIAAILELYHNLNCEFTKLDNILKKKKKDEGVEFEDLKNRVLKRHKNWEYFRRNDFENYKLEDWEMYLLLLPGNPRACDTQSAE